MSDIRGTLLLTARTFTSHCGKCGRAWSIPESVPDFEAQQRQVIEWFREHRCDYDSAWVPETEKEPRQ